MDFWDSQGRWVLYKACVQGQHNKVSHECWTNTACGESAATLNTAGRATLTTFTPSALSWSFSGSNASLAVTLTLTLDTLVYVFASNGPLTPRRLVLGAEPARLGPSLEKVRLQSCSSIKQLMEKQITAGKRLINNETKMILVNSNPNLHSNLSCFYILDSILLFARVLYLVLISD